MGDTLGQLTSALADRYRVIREIGAGGMATVYLAEDLRHGREVAIKVLRAEVAGALGADRFLREIAVTARLDHPGILPLLDSGNADGILYYVMPFVRGESLRERLSRERQLPVDDALDITRAVGDALTYAHALGVVHRDIKPDNILLSGNQARVADFGIARALSEVRGSTLTGTGIVVGSPAYMSPEQAAGERELDGRSDVYALGCVLYEMLAGQPPFSGPTQESLMRQHLVTPPPEVTQLRPLAPPHVAVALARAMAKAPADRFQTPAQFIAALRAPTTGDRSSPTLATATRGTRRRMVWFVGAAVIVVAGVGIWFSLRSSTSGKAAERPLIAVLPFRNIGSAEDEFFADGLTEEITSRLTTISSIGTISRTTSLSYKGSTKPLREIAKELGVTYVLEGTVRTERLADGTGQVRVTPELVRADADTPLWTDRMTAGLAPGELFKVQAQIAEQVASALNLTLLAGERQAIQRVETVDPEAHNAYLQGRFSLAKSSEQGIREAVAFFTQAVTRDSAYARAWAGLADAYASMPYFPQAKVSDSVAFTKAASAARRAIALDSTLSEARVSLGAVLSDGSWRWAEADREFGVALRLDPDNAQARTLRSALLSTLRRYDEAMAEAERAVQLEPASAGVRHTYATALTFSGRLDDAAASERIALTLSPTYLFAHIWLGEIAGMKRDFATMGREFQLVPPLAEIGRALVTMNATPASKRPVIQAIGAIRSYNPGLDAARKGWLYAAIGEVNRAMPEFETAIRLRSPGGLSALQFPTVQRALGSLPRYQALLRTAGIPQ
ncbi:MAG: protein kinase [Gemmatimonadaceae bacterium]|nr:protein kinase [Gemmatimonadaceae bacterium]